MPTHIPQGIFQDSLPATARSANESSFGSQSREAGDSEAQVSGFGDGDLMNVAVRMVVPLRREFGRMLDVTHFLYDTAYAKGIVDLARSSRDARLRGYAMFLEGRLGLVPMVQVLAEPAAQRPAPAAPAPSAPTNAASFQEAKILCARHLTDILGPSAVQMCLKIEAARSVADLVTAAQRAYAVVRDVRGAAQAERFGAAVEARLTSLVL